jgi:hypothetical protein
VVKPEDVVLSLMCRKKNNERKVKEEDQMEMDG